MKPLFSTLLTSSTTSVRADYSILFERYKLCGNKTTPQQRQTLPGALLVTRYWYAVSRLDNAMPCHRAGYDRHDIHILVLLYTLKERKIRRKQRKTNRKKNKHMFVNNRYAKDGEEITKIQLLCRKREGIARSTENIKTRRQKSRGEINAFARTRGMAQK